MEFFDDVTIFPPLHLLFFPLFFAKVLGFLLVTCKKTLVSIDMHSMKMFTLVSISTQNMVCEVILKLRRRSISLLLRKCLSKYSNSLAIDGKKMSNALKP